MHSSLASDRKVLPRTYTFTCGGEDGDGDEQEAGGGRGGTGLSLWNLPSQMVYCVAHTHLHKAEPPPPRQTRLHVRRESCWDQVMNLGGGGVGRLWSQMQMQCYFWGLGGRGGCVCVGWGGSQASHTEERFIHLLEPKNKTSKIWGGGGAGRANPPVVEPS